MTRLLEQAYEVRADIAFVASDKNLRNWSLNFDFGAGDLD